MRKRTGGLVLVFLAGMVFWAFTPALIHGAETPGGDVWDQFLDTRPFPGVALTGPLSIYYSITGPCGDSDYTATMYYIVKLNKNKDKGKNVEFYTFQGSKDGVCMNTDIATQGNEIRSFMENVVVPGIFERYKSWKFKSIDNAQYHDDDVSRAFVADIEIVVDKK
jgi:hypothetical protein